MRFCHLRIRLILICHPIFLPHSKIDSHAYYGDSALAEQLEVGLIVERFVAVLGRLVLKEIAQLV
jgi:hypothetical protein